MFCTPGLDFGCTESGRSLFISCAPGLVFSGAEGVASCFYVLRYRTQFRRCRVRQFPFSCFALPHSFSAVPRALCPFSCFARSESFSAVPRALALIFMFCAPGLVSRGSEGVGSHFHVLSSRTRFRHTKGVGSLFYAPELIFGGTADVGSRFHVLRSRTCFRRCGGCQVLFSCLALPDSFSAVQRASGPVFMFCAPGLVFGGSEDVGSRFHVLRSRTRFRRFRGRRPVFMFCAPRLIFSATEDVSSHFHVLRSRTCFSRYRGCRVPFSYFTRGDLFSAIPRASGPVFMFCAPGIVFDGIEGVESRFHVLHSRPRFRR
jgi:hypothetical protein